MGINQRGWGYGNQNTICTYMKLSKIKPREIKRAEVETKAKQQPKKKK